MVGMSPTAWTAALLSVAAAATALGQDDAAFDRTPQDCVVVANIDDTDAIDEQNIIFRMRGNRSQGHRPVLQFHLLKAGQMRKKRIYRSSLKLEVATKNPLRFSIALSPWC